MSSIDRLREVMGRTGYIRDLHSALTNFVEISLSIYDFFISFSEPPTTSVDLVNAYVVGCVYVGEQLL